MSSVQLLSLVLVLFGCACAAPGAVNDVDDVKTSAVPKDTEGKDLEPAASNSHTRRYTDWTYNSGYGGSGGGYSGATGYGLLNDGRNYYSQTGYDNTLGFGYVGQPGYSSYSGYNKGYGGYGGYSGNAGLNSYYGYNSPYYHGSNHLGYGYYNKPTYGNIYGRGITPNLVTGYRGYSRR